MWNVYFLHRTNFCDYAWVGLVRLQPDVRIHIKWWAVFCVCVCFKTQQKHYLNAFQVVVLLWIYQSLFSSALWSHWGLYNSLIPAFQDSDFYPVPPMDYVWISFFFNGGRSTLHKLEYKDPLHFTVNSKLLSQLRSGFDLHLEANKRHAN